MIKFYNRQREIEQLQEIQRQAHEDYSRFVVLTGRRRVGKTSLVYRLMQQAPHDAPGLYFFVGRKTEAALVSTYCDEVREKLGEFVPEGLNTFRGLFQLLMEVGKRRRFTLFVDEFQEFDNINPGVFSDIQELWDRYKHQTHVCLIVSGSIFSLMEKIFKDEGMKILVQEFGKQYGTYFSILDQIAHGDVTQRQIEASLGIKSLGGQLKMLEEKYGIIHKKRPIGAKAGSQTIRYEIQDNFFRFWFRYVHRHSSLIEIQNMPALEKIMVDDYPTFSGIALERWFRQRMMESCRYRQIGGWWQSGGKNDKGNHDDFEIDIVAEALDGKVEAIEVKRNPQHYNPARLQEKVSQMQRHLFGDREVKLVGLSMKDM